MKHSNVALPCALAALGLLALADEAHAQNGNCSGRFALTYPSGTGSVTQNFNNGSGNVTVDYCPSTAGANPSRLVVAPRSNMVFRLYRGTGPDTVLVPGGKQFVPNGSTFPFPLLLNPVSTTYSLRTDVACNNPKTNILTLVLAPSLSVRATVNGSPVVGAVCPGTSVAITATGASPNATYTLRDASSAVLGLSRGGQFQVSPLASTTYFVTTNTPSCGTADVVQQIAISTNNLTLSSNTPGNNVAAGTPVTVSASGGATNAIYTFTTFDGNTSTTTTSAAARLTFAPARSTQVTVQGLTAVGRCFSSVSMFILVGGQPLPVQLIGFEAAWTGQQVRLSWVTASETNSAYFAVERGPDGKAFATIGRQAAAGASLSRIDYQFADAGLPAERGNVVYYRLRQVDQDGTSAYSPVRAVRLPDTGQSLKAEIYPNPYGQTVTVRLSSAASGRATLTARDALGRTLLTQTVQTTAGTQDVPLPQAAAWPAGVYHLFVRQDGQPQQVLRLSHQ